MNSDIKKHKNSFYSSDKILLRITKIYLLPFYIIALLLRLYDKLKIILIDFVKYKLLKRKKENKVKNWWEL